MTTNEMLFFSGRILGPALLAEAVAETLTRVPALRTTLPQPKPRHDPALLLLARAFPNGLDGEL